MMLEAEFPCKDLVLAVELTCNHCSEKREDGTVGIFHCRVQVHLPEECF